MFSKHKSLKLATEIVDKVWILSTACKNVARSIRVTNNLHIASVFCSSFFLFSVKPCLQASSLRKNSLSEKIAVVGQIVNEFENQSLQAKSLKLRLKSLALNYEATKSSFYPSLSLNLQSLYKVTHETGDQQFSPAMGLNLSFRPWNVDRSPLSLESSDLGLNLGRLEVKINRQEKLISALMKLAEFVVLSQKFEILKDENTLLDKALEASRIQKKYGQKESLSLLSLEISAASSKKSLSELRDQISLIKRDLNERYKFSDEFIESKSKDLVSSTGKIYLEFEKENLKNEPFLSERVAKLKRRQIGIDHLKLRSQLFPQIYFQVESSFAYNGDPFSQAILGASWNLFDFGASRKASLAKELELRSVYLDDRVNLENQKADFLRLENTIKRDWAYLKKVQSLQQNLGKEKAKLRSYLTQGVFSIFEFENQSRVFFGFQKTNLDLNLKILNNIFIYFKLKSLFLE